MIESHEYMQSVEKNYGFPIHISPHHIVYIKDSYNAISDYPCRIIGLSNKEEIEIAESVEEIKDLMKKHREDNPQEYTASSRYDLLDLR